MKHAMRSTTVDVAVGKRVPRELPKVSETTSRFCPHKPCEGELATVVAAVVGRTESEPAVAKLIAWLGYYASGAD